MVFFPCLRICVYLLLMLFIYTHTYIYLFFPPLLLYQCDNIWNVLETELSSPDNSRTLHRCHRCDVEGEGTDRWQQGGTDQNDSQCVEVHQFCVDAMSVALQQTGHETDHVQPGVAHWRVQDPPGGLHDVFLSE